VCKGKKVKNSKSIVFILLGIAWLVAVALRGLAVPVLARFSVGDPVIMGFTASTLAAILLGVSIFVILNRHPLVVGFTDEVIEELRRVTWPDKDDTVQSTIVVVGVTLFIAGALGLYDYVWAEVTQLVLFTKG
jgi:preprotein translocase subunit SecE